MPQFDTEKTRTSTLSDEAQQQALNKFAERYIKLALAVGQHDNYYVDAYYGPQDWQKETYWQPIPDLLNQHQLGSELLASIGQQLTVDELSERYQFLKTQWHSIGAYLNFLQGKQLSFDEEAIALYDCHLSPYSLLEHQQVLAEIESLLPGEGSLTDRYNEFKSQFIVPKDKAAEVFSASVDIARTLTSKHMELPENESFEIEYVNDKVWTAYNWYKGDSHSLIQLNQDQPLGIERYLELASHEGYPGHHVFNVLQEQKLVKAKQWLEYAIYPLYSPISYLSEGSANYALSLIMSDEEVLAFERDILMPLAGLNGDLALFHKILKLVKKLGYFENYVSKCLTDKQVDAETAENMLIEGALYPESRAKQRVKFYERNRSYVINYSVGEDAVAAWVEAKADTKAQKWTRFESLLSRPLNASDMVI
ncbi:MULTISPECIES: hypothetical protein [unclassified Shewanella]|uniref:hypothetical protein n=1 Tax=unclassified Shewanella TaxID=196818 RepID=UPI001BC6C53C|nr:MULTISPECIES: hypothetical protein [unclassified Shewanella]GIU20692.1 hypothetical protein TUM4444_39250 [Shewanella sp. MBTL60-112-B1]GIU40060.1 hypothetical protein TUM4445_38390 [Shewanella sp. MBTL60-112-B2]